MNVESDLENLLLSKLKEKFTILDEQNLLLYLNLRYDCIHGYNREKSPEKFMQFVLRELYILSEPNGLSFQNEFLSFSFQSENSLAGIYDNWNFALYQNLFLDNKGLPLNTEQVEKQTYAQITKTAKRKYQPYKNSPYKEDILKYFKLLSLNNIFSIAVQNITPIKGVHQLEIQLSDEELLERYVQAVDFYTDNIKTITENDLRDYLMYHLDLLEDGLTLIDKEVPAKEGRIDILARDKDENITILELKVEPDKKLIWQCMYYPDIISKKYQTTNKIRTIVVCPEYPDYLLSVLRKIPDIELFQYRVISNNHQIKQLEFHRINLK